jgi:hypothetical protein
LKPPLSSLGQRRFERVSAPHQSLPMIVFDHHLMAQIDSVRVPAPGYDG